MSPLEAVLDEEPTRPVVEPPLGTKVLFRLGWPISEEYRGWVERDIASPLFVIWMLSPFVVAKVLVLWLGSRFVGGFNPWPYAIGGVIALAGVTLFMLDFKRRQTLAWHEKRWKRKRERDEGPDLRRFP